MPSQELTHPDVLVVGASLGGVAAVMRAASFGARVVLIDETDWLGGQLSSQGVCTPDENRWIEQGGGTASYRAFRARVRERYTSSYRLSEAGRSQQYFNPGACWVSRLSVEPPVAQGILQDMLAECPSLEWRPGSRVLEVRTASDQIEEVVCADRDGTLVTFRPSIVIDATELGDLLPMAGAEHVIGAESADETGEPDAPPVAHPEWVQPFTFPFALELRPPGENHTIAKPPDYERMKALQRYHVLDGAMRGMWGDGGWWTYRRIVAADQFDDPEFACDIAMINTGSNDFKGGILPARDAAEHAAILANGRLASLGYVYWLQTECPREDDPSRLGYPELKLRTDLFGTPDGIASMPYSRESRRIRALKTVLEQEIVERDSKGRLWQAGPRAAHFADSCGIGHYWLDIHEGGTPEPDRFLETKPFQIPLGALIPVRVTNLLAGCKNLGVTHLTNGAYRLHPIEWNIGEAAGALAAFSVARGVAPREVREDDGLLAAFQQALLDAGVPIYWWCDLPSEHPAFRAAQTLAVRGLWPGGAELEFRPDDPLTEEDVQGLRSTGAHIPSEVAVQMRRGAAAQALLTAVDRLRGDRTRHPRA